MKRSSARRNTADISDYTPLQYVCVSKDIETPQSMISSGVEINALNVYGETALHYAVKSGSSQIVELLLDHRADPNIQSVSKVTALRSQCW